MISKSVDCISSSSLAGPCMKIPCVMITFLKPSNMGHLFPHTISSSSNRLLNSFFIYLYTMLFLPSILVLSNYSTLCLQDLIWNIHYSVFIMLGRLEHNLRRLNLKQIIVLSLNMVLFLASLRFLTESVSVTILFSTSPSHSTRFQYAIYGIF